MNMHATPPPINVLVTALPEKAVGVSIDSKSSAAININSPQNCTYMDDIHLKTCNYSLGFKPFTTSFSFVSRTSREASHYWTLPLLFCRSHNLSLTPVFLIDCAVADKWLSFLTHAQFAQFPKTKVNKGFISRSTPRPRIALTFIHFMERNRNSDCC